MPGAVAVLVCSMAVLPCAATTLVGLWTPERIVLGADSMVVSNGPATYDGCKIVRSGSTWLALSGLVTDRGASYDVGDLARNSVAQQGTMQEKMSRFAESVAVPLLKALEGLRRDSPVEYANLAAGRPVLQAIFAAWENGGPVLGTVGFSFGPDGTLQARASRVDGTDARGPRVLYAGQQERIRGYLRSHRNWFEASQPDLVRNLVQLEIDARTGYVGGPVDVVEIGADIARWVQKKSNCQE